MNGVSAMEEAPESSLAPSMRGHSEKLVTWKRAHAGPRWHLTSGFPAPELFREASGPWILIAV